MNIVLAFVVGAVFGVGLIVSGMSDPAKVLGFLDLAGAWDPSLLLVMAAAVGVSALAYRLARRQKRSWLGAPISVPTGRQIDSRLLAGSAIFGVGWGLAGICPGPALVLLGSGASQALVFVSAMLVGMALFAWLERSNT